MHFRLQVTCALAALLLLGMPLFAHADVATVVCGGVAFLYFSYPILGQITAIALLSLLWLSYARKTFTRLRGRRMA